MKNKFIRIGVLVFLCGIQVPVFAQGTSNNQVFKGHVLSTNHSPVAGAILSTSDKRASVITDEQGYYEITLTDLKGWLKVTAEDYYEVEYPLNRKAVPEEIVLVPLAEVAYKGVAKYPYQTDRKDQKSVFTATLENKDFSKSLCVSSLVKNEFAGALVKQKSGMPGEGAYLNIRGLHSIVADNAPLFVINGVPYMGNTSVSQVLSGYSRDPLFAYDVNDIRSVTILKGADASLYGSLGSNGVVLIETAQASSDNLETRISFSGEYGYNLVSKTLPTLGVASYKTYLQDIGLSRYSSISELYTDYPFMQNGTNYYSYLFNNRTPWIDEVQSPAFLTENIFRVEGGDEIAKYNLSFGYTHEGGILEETSTSRYHTLINSDIMVSRQVDIFTTVSLAYISSKLQEQGMNTSTNAVLTSYLSNPMLSPYMKQDDNSVLDRYATYNGWNINSNPAYPYDNLSNAVAIVNTVEGKDKIYDANLRLGLNYTPNDYLVFTGLVNLYYNYTEEKLFVPGVTDKAIVPMLYNTGLNLSRMGVMKQNATYLEVNGRYHRVFQKIHDVNGYAAARYLYKDFERDMAYGYNTANDFYHTLGNTTDEKKIKGDNSEWKWLSYLLHADYSYNHVWKATANLSVDGTSVSGVNTNRFGFFPSLGLTTLLGNIGILPASFDLLNLSVEASLTGNSRFSSNYAKNYYQNSNLFNLGTITRSNVPNTKLQWEKKQQFDVGVDVSMFHHAINLTAGIYNAYSYDLLLNRKVSAVYGSSGYYDNVGALSTKGYEVSLRLNPVHTKPLDWVLYGSLSGHRSQVRSLGTQYETAVSFTDYGNDDAKVMMKVGEEPYQFYGYKTNGVYSSQEEAVSEGLLNIYGNPYQAGDVRFVDVKEDGVINDEDKVCLGSATPDFYGGFGSSLRYKQISIQADFGYSVGNKAYNAVRRKLESMESFTNQSTAVLNRWQVEGQLTHMPRAAYGDPSGNNFFSDRWIEDASYLKLRSFTIAYHFKDWWGLCRSGSVYLTGENLWTLTGYLGSDPEFAYSYDECLQGFDYAKVALPLTVKLGFHLNF